MKGITERVIRMLQRYKNILVPIDGSYEAELAFKKAVEVAKRNGKETKLQLVHVVDTRAFQNISSFDIEVQKALLIRTPCVHSYS